MKYKISLGKEDTKCYVNHITYFNNFCSSDKEKPIVFRLSEARTRLRLNNRTMSTYTIIPIL